MANRTVTMPGIWAKDAPDVSGSPSAGVTYGNSDIPQATVEAGWPFAQTVSSENTNEILRRITQLLTLAEGYGVLPWCALNSYFAGALAMGSDNLVYKSLAGSNLNHDPVITSGYWVEFEKSIMMRNYPIGSYYFNHSDSRNPSIILGFGTWVAVTNRFILGASITYPAGTTGGEATHTLTLPEIPAHTHTVLRDGSTPGAALEWWDSYGGTVNTGSAGGGGAHNNMPPWQSAYIWRRSA